MAQSTQISVSEPTFENALPHSPSLAAKRSHDQIEPVADAPTLKKVKTNDDTLDANVLQDTKMQDVQDAGSKEPVQELEHSAALAVLDDGVKESDAASGRSAWCMSFGDLWSCRVQLNERQEPPNGHWGLSHTTRPSWSKEESYKTSSR
jgi:hypothetical protein